MTRSTDVVCPVVVLPGGLLARRSWSASLSVATLALPGQGNTPGALVVHGEPNNPTVNSSRRPCARRAVFSWVCVFVCLYVYMCVCLSKFRVCAFVDTYSSGSINRLEYRAGGVRLTAYKRKQTKPEAFSRHRLYLTMNTKTVLLLCCTATVLL